MKKKRIADRYAKAIFELSQEANQVAPVHTALEIAALVIEKTESLKSLFQSPATTAEQSKGAMKLLVEQAQIKGVAADFLLFLAGRRRAGVMQEIAASFAEQVDLAAGITRGTVRSTNVLAPAEREKIEATVGRALNKKVILTYVQDSSVLGGLVAEVGSFRFDDSLSSHLNRMSEDLKRRPVEYGSTNSRG